MADIKVDRDLFLSLKSKRVENAIMEYNFEKFEEVLYLLKDFLYHYESHKEIHAVYDKLPGEKEFWCYSSDAHLKMATITWCMVFGTDSNKTHWKKITQEDIDCFRETFIHFLYNEGKITKLDYKNYWNDMLAFRNEYVAHRQNYTKPIPYFSTACQIVFMFDSWIRQQIKPDIIDFPSYEKLAEEYRLNIKQTLKNLIKT